jgi:hypothetical protein
MNHDDEVMDFLLMFLFLYFFLYRQTFRCFELLFYSYLVFHFREYRLLLPWSFETRFTVRLNGLVDRYGRIVVQLPYSSSTLWKFSRRKE